MKKLNKKKLTDAEYRQYLQMGEPDESQDWLELFTPTVISDLFAIINSSSDNQDKCDQVQAELEYYGFEPVGLGTNVYTVANPAYPGVVFKIALDDYGIADNFNDAVLYPMVNKYLGEDRFTRIYMRHPSGVVSVQERKVLLKTQDRMDQYREDILSTLEELMKEFLIVDLAPSLYQYNYGIDRDGEWCFIDASDLYPLAKLKKPLACPNAIGMDPKTKKTVICGGRLQYKTDFTAVVCTECHKEYLPVDVRPDDSRESKKEAVAMMTDGLTAEQMAELEQREQEALARHGQRVLRNNEIVSVSDLKRENINLTYVVDARDFEEDSGTEWNVDESSEETTAKDAEIIPSTFGIINRCEIDTVDEEDEDGDEPEEQGSPEVVEEDNGKDPLKAIRNLFESQQPEKPEEPAKIEVTQVKMEVPMPKEVKDIAKAIEKAEAPEKPVGFIPMRGYSTRPSRNNVKPLIAGYSNLYQRSRKPLGQPKPQEESVVEKPTVTEPDKEVLRENTTSIVKPETKVPFQDDEEDDGIRQVNAPKPVVEPHVDCEVIDEGGEDGFKGFLLKIYGEPSAALDKDCAGIFISLDGGTTMHVAISSSKLQSMIEDTVLDIMENQ